MRDKLRVMSTSETNPSKYCGLFEAGTTKYAIDFQDGQWWAKINGFARARGYSASVAVHEALKAMSGHGHHVFGFTMAYQDLLSKEAKIKDESLYDLEAEKQAREAKPATKKANS